MEVSQNVGTPNRWLMLDNPTEMDDFGALGYPHFRKPPNHARMTGCLGLHVTVTG